MGSANPSFQKRQKEQKRKEKADDKRAARLAKAQAPPIDPDAPVDAGDELSEGAVPPPPQDQ